MKIRVSIDVPDEDYYSALDYAIKSHEDNHKLLSLLTLTDTEEDESITVKGEVFGFEIEVLSELNEDVLPGLDCDIDELNDFINPFYVEV